MNRTVRRRLVAVPWSLFPRELSVGQVLSLSWRGHDCRTRAVVCASSPQGQRADFQCQSFSCGYTVCSGLFLAGISWSVRGAIISEGCLVGEYSLYFCAWSQLASCFWWVFLLLGNSFASWSATSFPCMLVCAGIHWSTAVVLDVRLFKLCIKFQKV